MPANHKLAANAADQLEFDQARQELDMIQPFGGAPRAKARRQPTWWPPPPGAPASRIRVRQGRQLQDLQMMGEQDLRGLGHSATAVIRVIWLAAEVASTLARGR